MKKSLFFLIVCFCLVLSGCFQGEKEEINEEDLPTPKLLIQEVVGPPEVVLSPIDKMIESMSLEEKIGQLMIIGVEGTNFSGEMDNLIRNYHVGGIIIMGKNVSTASEMLQLINDSKKANELNKMPLFVSVDEEGGRVSRLPAGIKKSPSNAQIGSRNDPAYNYHVGTYLAEVLNEFGYNMNYAPVLDVNSNPKNRVIGDRSFGAAPDQVAELGIATMRGLMDNRIISVVKHFPGHGDTLLDSHKALPVVNTSLENLRKIELVPFQRAIDEGVDAVMVAHILYPALDSDYPSSLSTAVITDLLRKEMQFDGVVITDDLTMGAIENEYTVPEAALQSFIAGSDVILIVGGYDNEINAYNALKDAVEAGIVSEDRLNESLKRILTLKTKYDITDEVKEFVDVEKINQLYGEFLGK